MPGKPRLEQDVFDEAVHTNMEDFGMEADEAVSSAVDEFELQGYDLSTVVKSKDGANTDNHPVSLAVADLASFQASNAACDQPQRLSQLASALQQQLRAGSDKEAAQQAQVIANRANAVPALLACVRQLLQDGDSIAAGSAAEAALITCLRTTRALLATPDGRAAFLGAGGCELAQALLRAPAGQSGGTVAAALGAVAESACFREEENKCRFVEIGFAAGMLRLLQLASTGPAACACASGALRALVNADDERSTGSKCFAHARALAKNDAAVAALLAALRRMGPGEPEAAAAVMAAIKQIAANDDICREFLEAGGTDTLLCLLRDAALARAGAPAPSCGSAKRAPAAAGTGDGRNDGDDDAAGGNGADDVAPAEKGAGDERGANAELARGAAGALRQLANSDAVKSQLAEMGALDAIVRALRVFSSPEDASVQEELLGLMAALTLRMPAIASAAADAGAIEALLEVLRAQEAAAAPPGGVNGGAAKLQQCARGGGGGASGGVSRQACMAVRNMVVRNPELRGPFLERGAEALLRSAKARHAAICGDVGSAALRDLGLDQYQ